MDVPVGNIVTAIATVVAVVLANKLTYRGSRKEKIWDLRRQAYGVILSELAAVERLCTHADEFIAEDAFRYFDGEPYNTINGQIQEHMDILRQRFSDDYLIISDKFIAIFEALLDALRPDDPNELPPEEHERFSTAVRKHRPRLMALARSEMPVQESWWARLFR